MTDTLTDKLKRAARPDVRGNRFLDSEEERSPAQSNQPRDKVVLDSADRSFFIKGLTYLGKKRTLEVSAERLYEEKLPQNQLIKRTKRRKWDVPNLRLYSALVLALYDLRDEEDDLKQMIRDDICARLRKDMEEGMVTSTKVIYSPRGVDSIIHDAGYDSQSVLSGKLSRSRGFLDHNKSSSQDTLRKLIGKEHLEIDKAFEWLTGKRLSYWSPIEPSTDTPYGIRISKLIDANLALSRAYPGISRGFRLLNYSRK